MNINIKNCDVNIIAGTETLEISGKTEITAADKMPATNTESTPAEETGVISQMTYTPKSILKNFDNVRIGDRVRLPAFTVPAVKMDGEEVLAFDGKHINADEAIVIGKDENGDLILIFDHCLFESAIDLNNEKRFEMTQLGQYLQSEFLRAMNNAGIPAESCGLISKEEMFGDNALEYFKTGRNRIGNTKANRAKYGDFVIDHRLNIGMTCCLKCNGALDISGNTGEAIKLCRRIYDMEAQKYERKKQ